MELVLAGGRNRARAPSRRRAQQAARATLPTPGARAQALACGGLLALEALGSLLMWAPIPLAWMWIGGQAYDATGSLAADGAVALLGFSITICATMAALNRLDAAWIALRRRSGHDQRQGALTQIVVASATLGLLGFMCWYYLLSHAFVLPFMPSQ